MGKLRHHKWGNSYQVILASVNHTEWGLEKLGSKPSALATLHTVEAESEVSDSEWEALSLPTLSAFVLLDLLQ